MRTLYSVSISLLTFAMRVAALVSNKARLWVQGRKDVLDSLAVALEGLDRRQNPVAWFHASSLGEFEQGRPVIEALRRTCPHYKILVTFYSPSGYEIRKNYDGADWVFYLPTDTRSHARRWVATLRPAIAIFIKYDFWYNYLDELSLKHIPVVFVSALFRPTQHFFQWYGGWFREHLDQVRWFFVQNEVSGMVLNTIGVSRYSIAGDTRFDRVYEISRHPQSFPLVEVFQGEMKLMVAGSTWHDDEELLIPFIRKDNPGLKFIIAPHDTSAGRIQSIEERLGRRSVRFSELTPESARSCMILIIDTMGILAHLYRYATLAYVGGGFGGSIHNIQEPVTFGKPVFFGPNYQKFAEAVDLVRLHGAFCVAGTGDLEPVAENLLSDQDLYKKTSAICRNYVEENRGATGRIMEQLGAMKLIHQAPPSA